MDTLVGGPGLRRGRRDSERIEFGEALDFWRVVGIDRDRSLSLLAEMKLPGTAMLNFDLEPVDEGQRTQLTMTARYRPKGLMGLLYWYAVVPLHNIVFGGMLKGIRKAAEKVNREKNKVMSDANADVGAKPGYGRARLWLGISAVGTLVTLSTLALALNLPSILLPAIDASFGEQTVGVCLFFALYMLIQLPFDFLGGYWLPQQFNRTHPPLGTFVVNLIRGALCHVALLLVAAGCMMAAGKTFGVVGIVAAGVALGLLLLQLRVQVASMMSPLVIAKQTVSSNETQQLNIIDIASDDEGFTGGVVGVLRARSQLLPTKWREVLGPEGIQLVASRRTLATQTGNWLRGRLVALSFTAVGLLLAALLVDRALLGTARGTVEISLWFSLWSFLGLLILPTFSRRGVIEIDECVQAAGYSAQLMRMVAERLDRLQDGERSRPSLVETIFHPVPSVENRLEGPRSHHVMGYWDAARTSIYLSLVGLGLLSRAVHCNCGRPALWVFLPTD